MDNKRLDQLVYMFSDITGLAPDKAQQIILLTDTGKAVYNNNMAVMYEQETANLYSIGVELRGINEYVDLSQLFSIDKIVTSRSRLRAKEVFKKEMLAKEAATPFTAPNMTDLKGKERKRLLEEQTRKLQIKRQNFDNIRSMKDADNA